VSAGLAALAHEDLSELHGRAGLRFLCYRDDLEKFFFDFRGVAPSDMSQNFASVVEATNGSQVSRGVRKHLNTQKQEDGRNTLEAEKKPPANVGVPVIDERKAEREPVGDRYTQVIGYEDIPKVATTMVRGRCLGHKDRGYTGKGTGSQSGDNTSDEDEI